MDMPSRRCHSNSSCGSGCLLQVWWAALDLTRRVQVLKCDVIPFWVWYLGPDTFIFWYLDSLNARDLREGFQALARLAPGSGNGRHTRSLHGHGCFQQSGAPFSPITRILERGRDTTLTSRNIWNPSSDAGVLVFFGEPYLQLPKPSFFGRLPMILVQGFMTGTYTKMALVVHGTYLGRAPM